MKSRFLAIIIFVLFIVWMIIVTVSQYWLIHWIIFGKTIYADTFYFIDKHKIGEYETN